VKSYATFLIFLISEYNTLRFDRIYFLSRLEQLKALLSIIIVLLLLLGHTQGNMVMQLHTAVDNHFEELVDATV
jgi:hypothetical protein